MWFKNLIFYRLTTPLKLNQNEFEKQLQKKRFRPCGSQDLSTYGWVSPLGRHGDMLTHCSNNFIMITARKEEKILPNSVIRDAMEDKIESIEQEQDRKMLSKEKKLLKDDIVMELLPRAFTRQQRINAYIDIKESWMVIDSSSFNKAEELTSYLRENIGSLPIISPPMKNNPSHSMTQWLSQKTPLPTSFSLGDECELREPRDDGGQIKASKQELVSEEISVHLHMGKQVSKLALCWNDTLTFVLGDDMVVRKLKYTDVIQSELDEVNASSAAEQFDADFSVMSLTLRKLIQEITSAMGGEKTATHKDEYQEKVAVTSSTETEETV
ncbi:MAG: recombination-associated protein RdgC [Candidatus Endonucleobacter bathymodioli]|uniref:Recombination-associated protein RdgC n=1 Tax=Candidatus Endonucleibacter bathymodioli TaxID=539814 RepID=A0AA90SD73_9GAMM|nr:recombination-associated protein RdgC [Candidatus Endonucleobacter bathymodioli]